MSGAEAAELILQLVEPISPENAVPADGGTAQNSYFGQCQGGPIVQRWTRSPTDTIRVLTLEKELARLFSAVLRRGASAHFLASSCAACLAISGGVL
jgi:hypothetical protein